MFVIMAINYHIHKIGDSNMNRPKNLDVFIYLRKSRSDIEEEKKAIATGTSYDTLARHRKQLLEVARNEGHNIVEIFEEVVSGEYIIERPEIQRLLREVENGAVDAVLVMDLERLGRGDMFDMGSIFRILQYSETLIITPNEVIDPLAEGAELLFGVKSIISREELKNITRRMQRGRVASAKEGKSITRKPPYGYLRDENLRLYPDPETSWVVQKIFQMIADGAGRQQVCRELDRLNIPTPEGRKHWEPSTISWILKNEVYIGHIVWGKTKSVKRNGKYVTRKLPPERWQRHDNAHEPIVSEELFKKANESHSSRWRPPTIATKTLANPLAGILKCELCGKSMLYQPRKDRPTNQIRCTNAACRGKQKGAILELVEQRVLDGLKQIVSEFEFIDDGESKSASNIEIKQRELDRQKNELKKLEKQKDSLHDLLEQGVYDINTFLERQSVIVERIKEMKRTIEVLNKEILEEKSKEKNLDEVVPRIKSVLVEYEKAEDAEKKNRLLKTVLSKVTYRRKKEWNKIDHFKIQLYTKI